MSKYLSDDEKHAIFMSINFQDDEIEDETWDLIDSLIEREVGKVGQCLRGIEGHVFCDCPPPMKRGRTEVETCRLNGWEVGTRLRGHEQWSGVSAGRLGERPRDGVWTTIEITALGESTLLAKTVKVEYTLNGLPTGEGYEDPHRENTWTLTGREWEEVTDG